MRHVMLWYCLLITSVSCSGGDDRPPKKPNTVLHIPKQQEYTIEAYLSPEFKQWFRNLGYVPVHNHVSKATVEIVSNTSWYTRLGIKALWIVVNASNETISFGGGGLNGALSNHVKTQYGHDKWQGLRLPHDDYINSCPVVPGQQVPAGGYAISDVGILCTHSGVAIVDAASKVGEIYHAVGPRASEVTSLSDAQDQVKALYYNILKRASHHTAYLVLPAISTAIFATADYTKRSFTKNQFMAAMYEGMYQGIKQYQDALPSPLQQACCIILNNWEPLK
jgi:O-acetyl-ADP-ribose deacetylase (regulator of RNase III)